MMMTSSSPAHSKSAQADYPSFLGDEVSVDYASARVVILPIPYEATTTYRTGCVNGPSALLTASQQVEYYDDELDSESWPVGLFTHPPIAEAVKGQPLSSEAMLTATTHTVKQLIDDQKFVVAIGGEHSITEGVVDAYRQMDAQPFTVVQIDAHGDLRQTYQGSIHNHACVMRRIVDMGVPTVQIGIRSLCSEEAALIREKNLTVFWARDMATQSEWIERAIASIPTHRVFLTIDLDGIDPSQMPGVGTPEPGGLHWYALLRFLRLLFESRDVMGCDLMELAPLSDSVVSEFTAAKLAYKLIGYQALAQRWC